MSDSKAPSAKSKALLAGVLAVVLVGLGAGGAAIAGVFTSSATWPEMAPASPGGAEGDAPVSDPTDVSDAEDYPSVQGEWAEFSTLGLGDVDNNPLPFGAEYTLWPLTSGGFLVSSTSGAELAAVISPDRAFDTFQMEELPRIRQGGGFSKFDGQAVYRFDGSRGTF